MIDRYSMPEMAALFDDEARFARWLEVELLATEAWSALGVVPAADAEWARAHAPVVDAAFVGRGREREAVTDHDVAAFVDVVQQHIGGSAGKWIHYGLTSSDVVDTALCSTLTAAADLLVDAASGLIDVLKRRALEHRDAAMVGPHPRRACRADHVRRQARPVVPSGRSRPHPASSRPRGDRGRQARRRGRHLLEHRPGGRGVVCAALGLVPVPATQVIAAIVTPVPLRVCVGGSDHRDDRDRGATPPAHRGR